VQIPGLAIGLVPDLRILDQFPKGSHGRQQRAASVAIATVANAPASLE
jgi:hypothetical protein